METGNARDRGSQLALYHCHRADRWRSDRGAISTSAICGSLDLEIPGERSGGAQSGADGDLPTRSGKHRACHLEKWSNPDQTDRLSNRKREEPGLRCRTGGEILETSSPGAGPRSLRKDFGAYLGSRSAARRPSFDETLAHAVTQKLQQMPWLCRT